MTALANNFEEPTGQHLDLLTLENVGNQFSEETGSSNHSAKTKKSSLKGNKNLNFSYTSNGHVFSIKPSNDNEYIVDYPENFLDFLGEQNETILIENFIYCKTAVFRLFCNHLNYDTANPYLENFINESVNGELPRLGILSKINASRLKNSFHLTSVNFQKVSSSPKMILDSKYSGPGYTLSLSFGKDSLLSYAILKELNTKYHLVSFDVGIFKEDSIKKQIVNNFLSEQQETVFTVKDETDDLYPSKFKDYMYLDYTNGLLSYSLQLIPVSLYFKNKYIVFGNQKDFDSYFHDREKNRVYYSIDQSTPYMKKHNRYINKFTNNNIHITSLIKPLYDISIYRLFIQRYPHLLKYIYSCEESPDRQWCENCEGCCDAYLYSAAFNGTLELGIHQNLFEEKFQPYYVLLSEKNHNPYQYVFPPTTRDQQLLGFLLAYRNNHQGALIYLFKDKFLKEAQRREPELRKRFFGVHQTSILPKELKNDILQIYRQELQPLQ